MPITASSEDDWIATARVIANWDDVMIRREAKNSNVITVEILENLRAKAREYLSRSEQWETK